MNRIQYLLTCLAEECAEVAHRASKAARFGLEERQRNQPLDNRERLSEEIGDLLGTIVLLHNESGGGIVPTIDPCPRKEERINKYYRYSQELGLAV